MYKYILTQRPAGIGCQPNDGLMSIVDKDKNKDGYYAIVTYTRELTKEELYKYEMKKYEEVER